MGVSLHLTPLSGAIWALPASATEIEAPVTFEVFSGLSSDLSCDLQDGSCTPALDIDAGALHITVYSPVASPNGFDALADEWNPLVKRSRFNTIFLTHEWQTTWWNYLGEGDLWILAFRDASEKLVAIAPLYLVTIGEGENAGKRQFNIVGCINVSDYLDLIIEEGREEEVYTRLLDWLHSDQSPHWDILDLCNLPEVSHTWQSMPTLLAERGLEVRTFEEDVAPQFSLPFRYDTYLTDQVEKKQRHEIRRKQRRAERESDLGFHITGPKDSLEADMDDFIALQRASRADKSAFMTPEMRRFFHGMAQVIYKAGWLRLCFLSMNGERVASLLAFEYDRKFLLYNSGYDPDSFAQLSPGWTILSYAIQYSVAVGCTLFDFMQGNEEYKYRFGAKDYRVMRVIASKN